jgi:hypothetical protein
VLSVQNTKNLRKKLKDSIDNLSDDEIKRLWEEYEELIIERELNKDPNFFKDAKDALNGVNIVSNEEVKRQLNL